MPLRGPLEVMSHPFVLAAHAETSSPAPIMAGQEMPDRTRRQPCAVTTPRVAGGEEPVNQEV